MKLGYLVPEFPTQTHIFFWREIEQLRKLGIETVLFSTRAPQSSQCPHNFAAAASAQTTYLFPPRWGTSLLTLMLHPLGFINALWWWLRMEGSLRDRLRALGFMVCAGYLMSQCRKRGVEHLHVHSCADAALVAVLCRRLGGPTYSMTLHNPLGVFGQNQKGKWRDASFGIVITQRLYHEVKKELADCLPPTVMVAPMGVNLERFRRADSYHPWREGEPCRIFSCGRLHPGKGHDVLIDAVSLLRREGLDVQLLIAGEDLDSPDGETRRQLERQREELGLVACVSLPGAISEEEVRGHLEHAHVFALASHCEPLGVVIMEAMAMGIPVVATSAGGVGELVSDGANGRLVPPGNPAAMAAAIRELLAQPDTSCRFSAEGRKTVERKFGSDVSAKAIVEGLKQLK